MKRIDLDLKNSNKNTLSIKKSCEIVLKGVGELSISKCITIVPLINNLSIKVTLISFLEGKSNLDLEIIFQHDKHIQNFNYNLEGKVILTQMSRAGISPVLKIGNSSSYANHKIIIGNIDKTVKTYLSSKGYSDIEIEKTIREEFENY